MKSKWTTKALFLMMVFAFSSVMGYAQNDDRIEKARAAAQELTTTMTKELALTDMQQEAVAPFNLAYANSLFSTEPLTDDAIAEIDKALDESLKGVLGDEQYELWTANKASWMDAVKSKVPKEEPQQEEILEEAA